MPYRTTPVFDAETLPAALRRTHSTKAGVWGIVRLLEGRLRLTYEEDGRACILSPDAPGLILPEQPHRVKPLGAMRMQVEFYDAAPTEPTA